jgi:hydroxylamine dehydrogenase
MANEPPRGLWRSARVLIIGLLVVLIVPGVALILAAITNANAPAAEGRRENVLVNSTDGCVQCHSNSTPGIVEQYGHSSMAAANVTCSDCHEVTADYPGAIEHQGTFVLNVPTTAKCQTCHQNEVAQFYASRHSLPAYVAMVGEDDIAGDPRLMQMYEAIPEVEFGPIQQRAALFDIEGPAITRFACESCHNVGRPAPDGSIGECQQCHLRHEFSLEQARKPETCNACHIGPDHPQWEIYQESPHGISYMTGGDLWNWEAEPGTLDVIDFPAPTCATCHFSGFGATGTTHDVGDRLTWYLFAPISDRRPAWQDNQVRMQGVCLECHNNNFITDFYNDADTGTQAINDLVQEGRAIVQPVREQGLMTEAFFDEPIDFVDYELWHHWGRTAKFGMWMQGADYTQWHGAYEMLSDLADLREMADALLSGEEATSAGENESTRLPRSPHSIDVILSLSTQHSKQGE